MTLQSLCVSCVNVHMAYYKENHAGFDLVQYILNMNYMQDFGLVLREV